MKAIIEQMVMEIKDNLPYLEAVNYAERVISEIIRDAVEQSQRTNRENGGNGKRRNDIEDATRTLSALTYESVFANEEKIEEL